MEQYLIYEFMDNPNRFFELHAGEKLGGGSFSTVMDSDVEEVVIKRCRAATEDMWFFYAAYCMTHGCSKSWMPKIYAVYLNHDMEYSYALMEKLDTQFDYDPDEHTRLYTTMYINGDEEEIRKRLKFERLDKTKVPIDDIVELMKATEAFFPDAYFDAHDENWLIRKEKGGLQHVLMDPLNEYGICPERLFEAIRWAIEDNIPNFWAWRSSYQ